MAEPKLTKEDLERAKTLKLVDEEWRSIKGGLEARFGDMHLLLNRYTKSSDDSALEVHRKIAAAQTGAFEAGRWLKLALMEVV